MRNAITEDDRSHPKVAAGWGDAFLSMGAAFVGMFREVRMQVFVRLSFWNSDVPAEVLEQLLAIAPRKGEGRYISMWDLDERDPRLAQMRTLLRAHGITEERLGYRPRPSLFARLGERVRKRLARAEPPKKPPKYGVLRFRRFEPTDFAGVPLVEPRSPHLIVCEDERTSDGHILLQRSRVREMKPQERGAPLINTGDGVLVPERVKVLLEGAGFSCMVFRRTALCEVIDDDRSRTRAWSSLRTEPLWEWRSDVLMPWVAPEQEVVERDTLRPLSLAEKRSDACVGLACEPGFSQVELTYSQREVDATLPKGCDAAMSRERTWTSPLRESRRLVVSARVRQWWIEQGFPTEEWAPVRLVK